LGRVILGVWTLTLCRSYGLM